MAISNDILSLTGIEQNYRWNLDAPVGTSVVVTYSFPTQQNSYDTGNRAGFTGFSDAHITYIEQALDTWSDLGGISFVQVPQNVGGDIQFSMVDMTGQTTHDGQPLAGYGYYPQYEYAHTSDGWDYINTHNNIGGDIFLNSVKYAASASSIAPHTWGYMVLLHEIGHAIGFKHPFSGDPVISSSHDNNTYSIMSYNWIQLTTSLGVVDKQAVQHVYGTTDLHGSWNNHLKAVVHNGSSDGEWLLGSDLNDIIYGGGGDDIIRGKDGSDRIYAGAGDDQVEAGDGNDIVVSGAGADMLNGGSGKDVLDYSGASRGVWINLANGQSSRGAKGDQIAEFENIIGSDQGNDRLTGNSLRNTLSGGDGQDRLNGGYGRDKLYGGKGNDRLNGGEWHDRLTGGQGADRFIFTRGGDKDVILDFRDNQDQIDLRDFGFASITQALSRAVQDGEDTVFRLGQGDRLIVANTTLEHLSDDLLI